MLYNKLFCGVKSEFEHSGVEVVELRTELLFENLLPNLIGKIEVSGQATLSRKQEDSARNFERYLDQITKGRCSQEIFRLVGGR